MLSWHLMVYDMYLERVHLTEINSSRLLADLLALFLSKLESHYSAWVRTLETTQVMLVTIQLGDNIQRGH